MALPTSWTTVTPLSRKIALICFVLFPIIGFFLGVRYEQVTGGFQDQTTPYLNDQWKPPVPSVAPTEKMDTSSWQTFSEPKSKFTLHYPSDWYEYSHGSEFFFKSKAAPASAGAALTIRTYLNTGFSWKAAEASDRQYFNQNHVEATNLSGLKGIRVTGTVAGRKQELILLQGPQYSYEIQNLDSNFLQYFDPIVATFTLVSVPTPTISPTCIPRPSCLDATPRCMIAESPNMCPAKAK